MLLDGFWRIFNPSYATLQVFGFFIQVTCNCSNFLRLSQSISKAFKLSTWTKSGATREKNPCTVWVFGGNPLSFPWGLCFFNEKTKHVFLTSSFFHCFLKGPPFFRRDSLPPSADSKMETHLFPPLSFFFFCVFKVHTMAHGEGRGHCSACFVLPPRLKAS